MGKLKALYTKHKKLFLAFGAAFAVSIFWVLIRGHSSAKSAAGAVITTPTGTGTSAGQSDSAVSQLAASVKSQFDAMTTKQDAQNKATREESKSTASSILNQFGALVTKQDAQSKATAEQINSVQTALNNNETAQGSLWTRIIDQIKNITQAESTLKDSINSVKDSVSGVQSSIQNINQSSTGGRITNAVSNAASYNQNTGSSVPSAPAGNVPNYSGILNFLSSAQQSVHDAVVNYHMVSDEGRQVYHEQAQAGRNNVLNYVSGLDSSLGFKVSQKDSGAGYNNIVVTNPDGSQTTY